MSQTTRLYCCLRTTMFKFQFTVKANAGPLSYDKVRTPFVEIVGVPVGKVR